MKLIRFMGITEMDRYLKGETLENHTDWSLHAATASKGFCFFPEDPAPERRLHYLSGIVDFDVVAEFELLGPSMLRKCRGRYHDPDEKLPGSLPKIFQIPIRYITTEEYSMESYSSKMLKLLRMGTVVLDGMDWKILWGADVFEEAVKREIRRKKVFEVFGSPFD